MYSKPRVARSNNTPDYVLNKLDNNKQEMNRNASVEKEVAFEELYKTGKMKYAVASKKIAFIDHGFDVFENPNDGLVWYKEGDVIVRQDDNKVKAVLDAIERGEEIEELL